MFRTGRTMSGESEEMQDGGSGVGEPHGPGPRHWQRVYFTARGPESADPESEGPLGRIRRRLN